MSKYRFMLAIVAAGLLTACSEKTETVSFTKNIKPLLDEYCIECHSDDGIGTRASGLQLSSYESLMKGTRYGPVIVAGNPEFSTLYRLIAGLVDPTIRMPHGKQAIPDDRIKIFENWISQGAKNN